MKRVFLDENVDPDLAKEMYGLDVSSVATRGWFGVTNGELLARLENEFDVLISHDRGLAHQHNWSKRSLALVVINCHPTKLESYVGQISKITDTVLEIGAGQIVELSINS